MSVGLHIMTPTSIVVAGSGSSASIRADGGVDFATATSLSLNGVFTSAYDDYMIVMRYLGGGSSSQVMDYRLRVSGTDATGSNYTSQFVEGNGTSVSGARGTATAGTISAYGFNTPNGFSSYFYGPHLAQPTAVRSAAMFSGSLGIILRDYASTHSLSTAYDGLSFIAGGNNFSGMVTVYGYAQ